jgi:vancomycin resistance protein YoaR
VPLVIEEIQPEILDIATQAEQARFMLAQPLTITIPDSEEGDPGPWTLDVPTLAQMLTFERTEDANGVNVQVALNPNKLRLELVKIAQEADRAPENARFIFNDDTRQLDLLAQDRIGRRIRIDASIENINNQLRAGEHTIPLTLELTQPAARADSTAQTLGISELVWAETSYFRGSNASRLQNIQIAASQFHGILIPPGATFSMGEWMGDISLDNGYAEALIIYGGQTITGIGGGVCQVSTTVFRAAFFAGFPIVERYTHAYRVSYYEQNISGIDSRLAGLDATVYFPLVDFKFTNDTPYWLLMETYFNRAAASLTWKLYSTKDGRSVQWSTTGLQNITPAPEPNFVENKELKKDEVRQVDWAADGATVTINRVVTRDGVTLYNSNFTTTYQPWRSICEYGPDTKDPEDIAKRKNLCQR